MKFFSTLKAERCLTQLSTLHGSDSPEAHKALESLRAIGPDATPIAVILHRPGLDAEPLVFGRNVASIRPAVPAFAGTTRELVKASLKAVDSPIPLP